MYGFLLTLLLLVGVFMSIDAGHPRLEKRMGVVTKIVEPRKTAGAGENGSGLWQHRINVTRRSSNLEYSA